MTTIEKNCRYDPVAQKMNRMRSSPEANTITMGEVLDASTNMQAQIEQRMKLKRRKERPM